MKLLSGLGTTGSSQDFDQIEIKKIARFLEILSNVSQRLTDVSSAKLWSIPSYDTPGLGCLDKIIIKLQEQITVESLRIMCGSLGYRIEGYYKDKGRFFLTIFTKNLEIHCRLLTRYSQAFFEVTVNPSLVNINDIKLEFIKLFGHSVLKAKIYRLDFTVDLFEEYEKVIYGLDVKFKSAKVEYIGKTSRTGIQIGSKLDKILIYNKSLERKENKPWTRIERQMSGGKVFIRTFGELCDGLEIIIGFDPLKAVSLNQIQLLADKKYNLSQLERFNELKALLKHEGYFMARKKLKDNFSRDYECFLTKIPYQTQPSDIFNRDIVTFFESKPTLH